MAPRHWLAAASLTLLAATGCGGGTADQPAAQPTAGGGTDEPPSDVSEPVDFSDGFVVLDNGWTVALCEGDAPVLCITDDERHVGIVEILAYPGDGDEPAARVEELYAMVREDRAATCGEDHAVETRQPTPATVGGAPGLRYGFALHTPDGAVAEATDAYMASVGGALYVVTAAAQAPGECPGSLEGAFAPADLETFSPYLRDLVVGLDLPSFGR